MKDPYGQSSHARHPAARLPSPGSLLAPPCHPSWGSMEDALVALCAGRQQPHHALVLRSLLVPLQTPGSFLPVALPFPLQAREALESISLCIPHRILPIHPTQTSQPCTPPGHPIAHPKATLRGAWEPSSTLCLSPGWSQRAKVWVSHQSAVWGEGFSGGRLVVPSSRSLCGQERGSDSGRQPCGSPVAIWGYKMLFAFSRSKELKMNKPVKLAVTAVFVCFASHPRQAPRAALCGFQCNGNIPLF